jgi:catechol 2,3-dioxygenase-like lactoylglutathione lyase family enzyme
MDTNFVSTRLIASDVPRVVAFYEQALGLEAVWGSPEFAELVTRHGTLAVASEKTVPLFGAGSAEPGRNRSAIVEFLVEDVDAAWVRLRPLLADLGSEVVTEPTTMPWGNRALLFRDPDGTLVNLFTPVSEEARAKFGDRA